MTGSYTARDSKMMKYLEHVQSITQKFKTFNIQQVPRDQNTQADALANLGSNFNPELLSQVPILHLSEPAVQKEEPISMIVSNVHTVPEPDSWTKPYYDYLRDDVLPINKHEAKAVRMRATRYTILKGVLFKRSASEILMRCIEPSQR
jgi:hypothetical protein